MSGISCRGARSRLDRTVPTDAPWRSNCLPESRLVKLRRRVRVRLLPVAFEGSRWRLSEGGIGSAAGRRPAPGFPGRRVRGGSASGETRRRPLRPAGEPTEPPRVPFASTVPRRSTTASTTTTPSTPRARAMAGYRGVTACTTCGGTATWSTVQTLSPLPPSRPPTLPPATPPGMPPMTPCPAPRPPGSCAAPTTGGALVGATATAGAGRGLSLRAACARGRGVGVCRCLLPLAGVARRAIFRGSAFSTSSGSLFATTSAADGAATIGPPPAPGGGGGGAGSRMVRAMTSVTRAGKRRNVEEHSASSATWRANDGSNPMPNRRSVRSPGSRARSARRRFIGPAVARRSHRCTHSPRQENADRAHRSRTGRMACDADFRYGLAFSHGSTRGDHTASPIHRALAALPLIAAFGYFAFAGAAVAAAATGCAGDCDGNGTVSIDELVTQVGIALGGIGLEQCPVADANGDGAVTIEELVRAVSAALEGCPTPVATATPTSSGSPSPTLSATSESTPTASPAASETETVPPTTPTPPAPTPSPTRPRPQR